MSGAAGDLESFLAMSPEGQRTRLQTGDCDEQLRALAEAAEQLAVADAGRALDATENLLPLADESGSALGRALIRRARGHALCNSGRLEEGWQLCDEAAGLAEQAGRPVEAGRARLRSMQALGELGRFDDSVAAGEAALAAFHLAGEDELAARAEVNLGIVFQRRDDPARAMDYFDRAMPRIGDAPLAIGTVENNRGEALLALNDFVGAEAAFQSALEHCERAQATLMVAVCEGNLADLASRQGMLHRAVFHFERARRRFESSQSSGHLARLLTEQAETISVLGLPDDAHALYETAMPQLDRAGQALEAARARAGLGRTLLRLRRFSDAETALAAAARAFEDLGHNTARARVDLVRAELAAVNHRSDEARRLIHAALSVLHDRPIEAATARHLLGRLALDEQALDTAEAEIAAALSLAWRLDLAPLLADVLYTSGRLRRRQGDLASAVRDLRAATEQIERVRGSLNAERFRGAFLGDRVDVYEDLLLALVDRGGEDAASAAFAVAEQAKSRLLLEHVRGRVEVVPDEAAADLDTDPDERRLVQQFARLRAELEALYSRLADEQGQADAQWQRGVADRERQIEVIQSRLSTTRGVTGLFAPPADLSTVMAALPPDTTLVEYASAGGEMLAFIVGDGRAEIVRGLAPTDEIDDRVARLHFQINRALRPGALQGWREARLLDDVTSELAELDAALLAPLRPRLPEAARLLIVPHGSLHLLPFHALRHRDRYLIEQHEVHYAPSASLYVPLVERPAANRTRRGGPVVVGVADAAAPRIEDEARLVARLLDASEADVLLGKQATVEHFGEIAGSADILHLACHARFATATPLGSGVRLADRWLTVRDIFGLHLDADLVTLSGCESGRSQVRAGDELVGLLRGFFAAGASSLLVSLWRIEDESAFDLMTVFYTLLARGGVAVGAGARALREAQLEVLARRPHPAHWAPFRLVGRP